MKIFVKGCKEKLEVEELKDNVNANVRYGLGFITCIIEAFGSLFGFRNKRYENKVNRAKEICDEIMIEKAREYGANAIINAKYYFYGLHVFAYGQAVKLANVKDEPVKVKNVEVTIIEKEKEQINNYEEFAKKLSKEKLTKAFNFFSYFFNIITAMVMIGLFVLCMIKTYSNVNFFSINSINQLLISVGLIASLFMIFIMFKPSSSLNKYKFVCSICLFLAGVFAFVKGLVLYEDYYDFISQDLLLTIFIMGAVLFGFAIFSLIFNLVENSKSKKIA